MANEAKVTQSDLASRWQNFTTATFQESDRKAAHQIDASLTEEQFFACESCEEILFQNGDGSTLFRAEGSGQMKLPPGIRVRAKGGSAKSRPVD
ncbi:uncharacterized protein N7473_006066 [Penicillium subrubescens]|uniref:uncharacterized protein n=1 Tax=Penicillium subrubescens TaxID=1316194 RepID=UPI002544EFFF|nr:uncharacterized protein N7473_006066 [Penicillium subrubescens]KAJ5896667.1 hypothetical protein N7473_006066 [Penicillium subrubescens]